MRHGEHAQKRMHHVLHLTMTTASLMKRYYCGQQAGKRTILHILLLSVCVFLQKHIRNFLFNLTGTNISPKMIQV